MLLACESDSRQLGVGRFQGLTEWVKPFVVGPAVAIADRVRRAEMIRMEVEGLVRAVFADYFANLAAFCVEAEAFFEGGAGRSACAGRSRRRSGARSLDLFGPLALRRRSIRSGCCLLRHLRPRRSRGGLTWAG